MRTCSVLLIGSVLVLAGTAGYGLDEPVRVDNFRLPDHRGRSHELYRYRDAAAVVLFYGGNGCPIVRQSVPELKRLRDVYAERGVVFLMVNANPQDSRDDVAREAEEFAIDLPILRDDAQTVTRMLGVTRTGEALVINPRNWRVVYRGAIDDRFGYGTAKAEPEKRGLQDALEAVLNGRDVETPQTEVRGCLINVKEPPKDISYSRNVAPIVAAKCITCHTDGGAAPFAFEDYEDVSSWGPMIREVVLTQRMPPWHADHTVGTFANDRGLTLEEARLLTAWVESGTPRGEGEDPLAAVETPDASEWPLGPPDRVVSLPEPISLPAEGVFDYMYFRVPSELTEDRWVRAVTVQPGNRRVLHHALIFLEYPRELSHLQQDVRGGLDGFFAGYVPGQAPEQFPEGTAKFIPKGTNFIFQMHYTATGRDEQDQTRLGLYFADEPPKYELVTRAASATEFEIPPGDPDYTIQAELAVPEDVILWALSPHMHYRGSWFEYEARYPDGRQERLLSVPNYDFNWQSLYRFEQPKRLPKGTVLVCRGGFDNSPRNPANPDPGKAVTFGEQTWDEMFIGYVNWSPVREPEAVPAAVAEARQKPAAPGPVDDPDADG